MSSEIPRTPPRRGYASQLWTPATPRYAPIDEPDVFPEMVKPSSTRQSPRKEKNALHLDSRAKQQLLHPHNKVSAITLPLTPEQTPINRKKKDLDLITRSSTSLGTSGRILFPTSSPAKGTGRRYKYRHTTENHEKPDEPKSQHLPQSLDSCPSTAFASPVPHASLKKTIKKTVKTLITSPTTPPKLNIFNDSKAFKAEVQEDAFLRPTRGVRRKASESLESSVAKKPTFESIARHPHDTEIDPTVPGMWYNFRGKKIFRPYPAGVSPLGDYEPKVLFGRRKDSLSLEMSTTPIPKRNRDHSPFNDEMESSSSSKSLESFSTPSKHVDSFSTPSKPLDSFTARLMQSVSKSRGSERQRATTPEIDTDEEDATDHEDNSDQPQMVTATTTTTTIHRRQFARPVSRTPGRNPTQSPASTKKHFFR